MDFYSRCEIGLRTLNEDRCWQSQKWPVCAVLDGCCMGGKAADIIVEAISGYIDDLKEPPNLAMLSQAVKLAEKNLHRAMQANPSLRCCGTTLDLISFKNRTMSACHVGDGRIYRLHRGRLRQISSDHTYIAPLIQQGKLSDFDARVHPFKNVITNALGAGSVWLEGMEVEINPGDIFFACTDGIWKAIDEPLLEALLLKGDCPSALDRIIQSIGKLHDNATIALVHVRDCAQ